MIATTRFSSVRLVAGVAAAALCCYMLSQWVAGERAALAKVDREIAREQDAIAKLTTEITTRSRLTQVESWNRQLALQAPRPGQYLDSGFQLASLYARDGKPQLELNPAVAPNQGPIQQASLQAPAPAPVVPAPAKIVPVASPAPAPIQMAAFHAAPKPKVSKPEVAPAEAPLLHTATFVRPKASRLEAHGDALVERAAFRPVNLLPASLLSSDIAGLAKAEQAKRVPKKTPE